MLTLSWRVKQGALSNMISGSLDLLRSELKVKKKEEPYSFTVITGASQGCNATYSKHILATNCGHCDQAQTVFFVLFVFSSKFGHFSLSNQRGANSNVILFAHVFLVRFITKSPFMVLCFV